MIEVVKEHLLGWAMPLPSADRLPYLIAQAQHFIGDHNLAYDDSLDASDPHLVALALAYQLWTLKATIASSTKGAVSISQMPQSWLDTPVMRTFAMRFAKRFSAKHVSVI